MNKTALAVVVAVAVALGAGFLLGRRSEQGTAAPVAAVDEQAEAAPSSEDPPTDVRGLPALYIPGREYERNDMPITEYFSEFSPEVMIDPETRKVRPEAAERLKEELVGKQVTWEGYVQRVKTAPSGRLVLVMQATQDGSAAQTAMIKFSPVWADELQSYRRGQHVRVVGLFDRVFTVFPSLNGMSVEALPAASMPPAG